MKTYKFQLKPNKEQIIKLNESFYGCRFVYNKLLEELNKQKKIDRNKIQHKIVVLKKQYPQLKHIYSKTLQYECYRLFSNLKGLSQLKKKGRKVGKLRFKGEKWFKTIVYNQSGFKLINTNKHYNILQLSKIGDIRIRQHRKMSGNIKGIIIKRKVNSWEAHVITDEKSSIKKGKEIIGIDLGIINFIVTSKNEKINNPLYMKKSLSRLQRMHKKISKTKKGSRNRKKYCLKMQKIWERVDNQKKDFFHKTVTGLIKKCAFIAVEKLNIKSMTSNKKNKNYNHRNIIDSSWGLFLQMLKLKAENAGVKVEEVDPKNTTKMCSNCGKLQNLPISVRVYSCNNCGLIIGRDYNSAINVLKRGIEKVKGLGRAFVGEETIIGFSMNQEAISLTPKALGYE